MNWIDILLVIVILFCIWGGWQRGFIGSAIDIIQWIGSLLISFLLYKYTAEFIGKFFNHLGVWLYPLAFVVTVIFVRIIFSVIVRSFSKHVHPNVHQSIFNKALGMLPGTINGIIYTIIIVAMLFSLPITDGISAETKSSRIAGKAVAQVEWLDAKLSPVFDEAIKKTISSLTVEPGSKETVNLNFKVDNPVIKSELEIEMLGMVNQERKKEGLQPLKADPEMTMVARAHSHDMFTRGYFSHYSPEGKDPFDRMRKAKVRFIIAGENLALGRTVSMCHKNLMNSPGHKANILRPAFGRLGIGILDGGRYGLMVSQEFRN